MPDLNRTPVLDWVAACAPEVLVQCAEPVRAIEDKGEIQRSFDELGRSLDAGALVSGGLNTVLQGTDAARDLRTVLTQLGPARLLRLLRWLGTEGGPERAAVLQALLDTSHPDSLALRVALEALNRRELLRRIFDEERLQQLLIATNIAREGTDP